MSHEYTFGFPESEGLYSLKTTVKGQSYQVIVNITRVADKLHYAIQANGKDAHKPSPIELWPKDAITRYKKL